MRTKIQWRAKGTDPNAWCRCGIILYQLADQCLEKKIKQEPRDTDQRGLEQLKYFLS